MTLLHHITAFYMVQLQDTEEILASNFNLKSICQSMMDELSSISIPMYSCLFHSGIICHRAIRYGFSLLIAVIVQRE